MSPLSALDFDTDEETDELLEKQYVKPAEACAFPVVKEPIIREKASINTLHNFSPK